MCTDANKVLINNVLDDFIGQGRAFTAFEVSLEAKKRGADERHRHMRAYIHQCQCLNDELEFGGYEKTMVDVGGGNQAFLYHPTVYDPSSYVPLDTNNAPQTSPGVVVSPPLNTDPNTPLPKDAQPVPMPTVPADDDDDDGSDAGHSLDYRNRLMVPTRYFRDDLSVSPKERVKIVRPTQGDLYLIPESGNIADGDDSTEQVVERNGDLRLSLGTLLSAGLDGKNFEIETSTYNGQTAVKVSNID